MDLLAFPPELLARIIEFSMPQGFENLMMTCRAVYACGQCHIATHSFHKERWKEVDVKNVAASRDGFMYLAAMAMEPLAADYIRRVDYQCIEPASLDTASHRKRPFSHPHFSMAKVKTLIHQSPHMRDAARIWDLIAECDEFFRRLDWASLWRDWELLLFLTQLRNVETLTLRGCWNIMVKWQKTSHIMKELTRAGPDPEKGAPLAKLKTLRIFTSTGRHDRRGVDCLWPFLELKCLERFCASGLGAIPTPVQGQHPAMKSSLISLELVACSMDEHSIANLLVQTPLVRSFKYSHQSVVTADGEDWNAAAFIAAVARICGHQLTYLAVTIDDLLSGGITNGVTTLKDFVCLERVELEVAIFAGPPLGDINPSETSSRAFWVDHNEWQSEDVPKLVEMLPPSIKSVRLFHACLAAAEHEVGVSLLRDFSAGRDWLLSDLEELSYTQLLPAEPDPQEQLGIEKVEEQAKRANAAYLAGTALQPVWRRAAGSQLNIYAPSRPALEPDYFE